MLCGSLRRKDGIRLLGSIQVMALGLVRAGGEGGKKREGVLRDEARMW